MSVGCGLVSLDSAAQLLGTYVNSGEVHRLLQSVYSNSDYYTFLTRVLVLPLHYNEACSLVVLLNLCDIRDPAKTTVTGVDAVVLLSPLHSFRTVNRLVRMFVSGSISFAAVVQPASRWSSLSFLHERVVETVADDGTLASAAMISLSRSLQDSLVLSKTETLVPGQY